MSAPWLHSLTGMVAEHGTVVRVSVIRAEGSTPRGAGTAMVVTDESCSGTIGGGTLELEAVKTARAMLSAPPAAWQRSDQDYPLGPALGQCCGGRVQLLFEVVSGMEIAAMTEALGDGEPASGTMALRPLASGAPMEFVAHRQDELDGWYAEPLMQVLAPLYLYGAGHVGRAVIKVLADLPFQVHWVDTGGERFPDPIPTGVQRIVAAVPAQAAAQAAAGAWHVVMTFSHAIDFEICRTTLARGDFAYLGVIASKTKRARFVRGFRDGGLPEATIARLHAPIGISGLEGKEPPVIAVSLAADLLLRLQAVEAETALPRTGIMGEKP